MWRFDLKAEIGKQWTHFTTTDGLGDDNAYAIVSDMAGRVWVGTNAHGVSVFNGQNWKIYDQINGPLGVHVTALAISPLDGGVWGATEAGLFRYKGGIWSYFTRANGLPSDQATALTFDTDGTLYVGTLCDGIAVATSVDNYKSWRVTSGTQQMPSLAVGEGLPSAQINCLLVTRNNIVYAGTPLGLAQSKDRGLTWHFRRGLDWKERLAGLTHPITPDHTPISGDLLKENYVTCLSEAGPDQLFIGHRQGGIEVFDMKTGKRIQSGASGAKPNDFVAAILVKGQAAWVGLYGGGLLPPTTLDEQNASAVVPGRKAVVLPLPIAAAPPTLSQLRNLQKKVSSAVEEMPVGGGVYLGEDWATQGDWIGRYGSRYTMLCAAAAPLDQYILSDPSYHVMGFSGPHHTDGDTLRAFCGWVRTDDPRVLWDPITGYRREAEWDDHGEDYSQSFEGPDVWARVSVPAGLHRLSLYLMNKDGHNNENRYRDYLVELKIGITYSTNIVSAKSINLDSLPTATYARTHNFWYGVYEKFLVRGPSVYMVKVGRNGSYNTILQAVMLDKVSGPPTSYETRRSLWYGKDTYHIPTSSQPVSASVTMKAAQNIWDTLDKSSGHKGAEKLSFLHLLAYRAAIADKKSLDASLLLRNWCWQLAFWDASERQAFLAGMKDSRQPLLDANPKLVLENQ